MHGFFSYTAVGATMVGRQGLTFHFERIELEFAKAFLYIKRLDRENDF